MKIINRLTVIIFSLGVFNVIEHQTTQAQGSDVLTATILGSGSPQHNPDRAGPAVLISYGETDILVDIGNGTQARLSEHGTQIRDLDGLLITHNHLDHNEEFTPVFIRSLLGGTKVKVAGPDPLGDMVENIYDTYDEDINYRMRRSGRTLKDVKGNVSLTETKGGETFNIGPVKITTAKVNHTIYTTAFRFDAGGQSVVVTGDLTYSESIGKLAKNADYMIIDSGGTVMTSSRRGQQNRTGNNRAGQNRGARNNGAERGTRRQGGFERAHVNLDETSRMAAEADVEHLVMTHFRTGDIDEAATREAIAQNYSGEVIFAKDLMVLSAGSHGTHHPTIRPAPTASTGAVNLCTQTPTYANRVDIVEDTKSDKRIITANAIPTHKVGSFPTRGNPNTISEQNKTYRVDLTPTQSGTLSYVSDKGVDKGGPNYVFGVAINGVKIEPSANEYFRGTNGQNTDWTIEALSGETNLGEDCNNAHVQRNGEYHYHGAPTGLLEELGAETSLTHVGWAADGFPIYYGTASSSYRLRSGTRPGDGQSAPDGAYTGRYVRDYEYVAGLGALDECHGRTGVTSEFPQGTYYYMITDAFPFVGRCLKGEPSADFKIGAGGARGQGATPAQTGRQGRRAQGTQDQQGRPNPMNMDRNGDGRISKDEVRGRLKDNFDRRDRNGDGYLTPDELGRRR